MNKVHVSNCYLLVCYCSGIFNHTSVRLFSKWAYRLGIKVGVTLLLQTFALGKIAKLHH